MEFISPSFFQLSEFVKYVAEIPADGDQRVPPLSELSTILGISVATLREQMEAARLLGIVEIKPRSGIRKVAYDFKPAVVTSLAYSVTSQSLPFEQYASIRKHLEAAYFIEAVRLLSEKDIETLEIFVKKAQKKLHDIPGQNPTQEHREFHLLIYKNLQNQFLFGLLESFWDLYRIAGLEVYPDLGYLDRVWQYHARIVDQIKNKNFNEGLNLMLEHMELIDQRQKAPSRLSFE